MVGSIILGPLLDFILYQNPTIGFVFQESEVGTEREQEQSEYESATEDNEVGCKLMST